MSNQELEKQVKKLDNVDRSIDRLNHPIAKILLGGLGIIPMVGSMIGAGIDASLIDYLKKEQEQRLLRIIELIISDENITSDMVKDIKEIMSFAKMLDVVRRLITNEKLDYLGRLYKNLIIQNEKNYNEYEEYLRRLDELSFREIEILHILDELGLVIEDLNDSKQKEDGSFEEERHHRVVQIESKWLKFQDIILQRFQIDSLDLQGYMQSISRSGFCVQYKVIDMPIRANNIFAVTQYYRNFANMIYK